MLDTGQKKATVRYVTVVFKRRPSVKMNDDVVNSTAYYLILIKPLISLSS